MDYKEIKDVINNSDAIIIGAGAGLSTAAGIDYGEKNFKQNFPELVSKYGFTDMYTSSFYKFDSEEERWSYWSKHISYLCLDKDATKIYKNLFNIVKDKNYFVITTNVDRQFIKSGFDEEKVFEIQGSLTKIQCSKECHDVLYDDTDMIKEMIQYKNDIKVPSNLVPYCPRCGETMEVNLRKDNFFVEDDHWHDMNKKYYDFIRDNKDKKIVFIELGAGFNTPGIIRYPFEEMTYKFNNATLIRINDRFADVPEEIENKSFSICGDINKVLEDLL